MWLQKWSPDFKPEEDLPIAPVWVLLPGLPFHMHTWNYVKQVVSTIGIPLEMDLATRGRTRPSMAKVRVEIDLLKDQPNSVYVGQTYDNAPQKGFVQKIEFEGVPKYCKFCRKLGNNMINCRALERKKAAENRELEAQKTESIQENDDQNENGDQENKQEGKKALTMRDYVNESTSVPSEIKNLPGIDVVVDLNIEPNPKQDKYVTSQQIEVTSPNRVTVMIQEDQLQTDSKEGSFQVIGGNNMTTVLNNHEQQLTIKLHYGAANSDLYITTVYAKCTPKERRDLWSSLELTNLQVVEEVWKNQVNGNPLWRLQQKLKMLSRRLTQWCKEDIGNVFDQFQYWENKMRDLEQSDLTNSNDISRTELNKGQAEYIRWMGIQDDILRQKARVNWFEEGDANTKYFNSTIRYRRRRLKILKIKDHRGHWIEGDSNIGKAVVHHFQQFFNINHHFNDHNIINCIP
ncbi:hypothetical protein A4A49_24660 [Nicotiana attenuata]|uniref:Uncharacterized protein n=1 Tax=Nicotiana attenuata TaxID=49451 RepID=A0A314L1R8_NICAT|nr:hypothetical protein A4A49_24660 [Nicotiana attenuata]